jgi:gas vesicle protein
VKNLNTEDSEGNTEDTKKKSMAKSTSKFILAGLAGMAAGLAVGILIAPDKGTKTRKRMKQKLQEVEEALKEGDLAEKIENLKSIFNKNTNKTDDADHHEPG